MLTIVALGAAGLLLLAAGIFAWTRARAENSASVSWPSVAGTVTSATMSSEMEGTGQERRRVTKFTVAYRYAVDGMSHTGSVYTENLTHFPALEAKYRSGGPVTVFYNPANPGHHDIREPLAHNGNLTTGKLAFFLIVLGVIALGAAVYMKFAHP